VYNIHRWGKVNNKCIASYTIICFLLAIKLYFVVFLIEMNMNASRFGKRHFLKVRDF